MSGNVRVIAVGSSHRLDAIPNVPTVAESRAIPVSKAQQWFGLLA